VNVEGGIGQGHPNEEIDLARLNVSLITIEAPVLERIDSRRNH